MYAQAVLWNQLRVSTRGVEAWNVCQEGQVQKADPPLSQRGARCQVASRRIGFRNIIVHEDIIDPPYTISSSIIREPGKRVACADLSSGSVVDSRTNLGTASR
jgi:hypothetical protein